MFIFAAFPPDSPDAHVPASLEGTPPFIVNLRMSLPPVPSGEEVLARWSDDGWYYRGKMLLYMIYVC